MTGFYASSQQPRARQWCCGSIHRGKHQLPPLGVGAVGTTARIHFLPKKLYGRTLFDFMNTAINGNNPVRTVDPPIRTAAHQLAFGRRITARGNGCAVHGYFKIRATVELQLRHERHPITPGQARKCSRAGTRARACPQPPTSVPISPLTRAVGQAPLSVNGPRS